MMSVEWVKKGRKSKITPEVSWVSDEGKRRSMNRGTNEKEGREYLRRQVKRPGARMKSEVKGRRIEQKRKKGVRVGEKKPDLS